MMPALLLNNVRGERMFLTSLKFVVSEVLDYLSLWKSARSEALQSHLLILQQDDITENLEHQRWGKIKSSRKIRKNIACVAMQMVCVGAGKTIYWELLNFASGEGYK